MRLMERTLSWVEIAPRTIETDDTGGAVERFTAPRKKVRASVIPSTGGLKKHETGLRQVQTMCMLTPIDTDVSVGDGIFAENALWRCTEVRRWTAHLAIRLERAAAI